MSVKTRTEHPSQHGPLACMRHCTDHCFQISCTCPAYTHHLHKCIQQVFMECRWQSFFSDHYLAVADGESLCEVSSLLLARLLDVNCTSSVFVALPSEVTAEAGLQSRHLSRCISQWLLVEGRPNVQHCLLLDPAHVT